MLSGVKELVGGVFSNNMASVAFALKITKKSILQREMIPSAAGLFPGAPWIFQQDNDPKHMARHIWQILGSTSWIGLLKSPDHQMVRPGHLVDSYTRERIILSDPQSLSKLKRNRRINTVVVGLKLRRMCMEPCGGQAARERKSLNATKNAVRWFPSKLSQPQGRYFSSSRRFNFHCQSQPNSDTHSRCCLNRHNHPSEATRYNISMYYSHCHWVLGHGIICQSLKEEISLYQTLVMCSQTPDDDQKRHSIKVR